MTLIFRLLRSDETDQAADLHRRAGAFIPGYDRTLHTPVEFNAFYSNRVFRNGPLWGAFENSHLVGHLALIPGWIEHLYVEPGRHGEGFGSALVQLAQRQQDDLQLYTFQSNKRARALYERHDFVIEDLTDGQRNEEKLPDVRYRWHRR